MRRGLMPYMREYSRSVGRWPASLSFPLKAQRHHHIGVFKGALDTGLDFHAAEGMLGRAVALDSAEEVKGYQRGRSAEGYIRAHSREAPEVGARHAAVQQVANYDDLQAFDLAEVRLDCEQV